MSIWFYYEGINSHLHKDEQLQKLGITAPKLFTIHCKEGGGIEAYFIGNNLYYRVLPIHYTEPVEGSNGLHIGEFKANNWYYLGIEHEKKSTFMGRS